jgi:S-adenosylmethionine synthetase
LRPRAIIERFGLKNPIFSPTAAYGHMGREPFEKEIETFRVELKESNGLKEEIRRRQLHNVQFFGWEKLDYVKQLQDAFKL